MYDELVKRLRKWANSFCGCCKHANKKQKACDDCTAVYGSLWEAADAIEELKKQLDNAEIENIKLKEEFAKYRRNNRWIPVTERLPEKHDRVLVYSKATRMGRSIDFINSVGNWYTTPKVTHWMPLPEPPKDGEE